MGRSEPSTFRERPLVEVDHPRARIPTLSFSRRANENSERPVSGSPRRRNPIARTRGPLTIIADNGTTSRIPNRRATVQAGRVLRAVEQAGKRRARRQHTSLDLPPP